MYDDISRYYQQIVDGEATVGKWVRLVYEMIMKGLQEKQFFFDAKKASRAIRFIETFCHHSKGRNDLIVLELWQRALVSAIFGVTDGLGNRQFREVIVIIARKNGKSLLASAIIACLLYIDGEYGAEIYCVAPKLEQAAIVYSCFWETVKAEEELREITKPRKSDYYVEDTNSFVKKIAFNYKKADGLNPHGVICDEFAAWPGIKGILQYEVLTSAFGSRLQPLLLAISTAGYENEGIYDELMKRCTRVLMGESKEKRLLPIMYMIDDVAKWNSIEELKKSNPNLGVSVSIEHLLNEIDIAESSLSKKAEFIAKYGNIKQSSSMAWLPGTAIQKIRGDMLQLEDFRDCYCVGGIDLSQTTDLTAATIIIEKDGKLYVFAKFFLPREKIDIATARDELPYRLYIERGLMQESGENFVDYKDVYDWFVMLVEQYEIYPLWVGYDRYSAQNLVQEMQQYGFHMDPVYQGENLTGIINETEGQIMDRNVCIGDNDLLAVHMLNSALKINSENERKRLVKIEPKAHVDGMAALLDAMCMRAAHSVEIGERLKNAG